MMKQLRTIPKEFNSFKEKTEKDIEVLRANMTVLKGSIKMIQWMCGLSIVLLGTVLAGMLHLSGALPF